MTVCSHPSPLTLFAVARRALAPLYDVGVLWREFVSRLAVGLAGRRVITVPHFVGGVLGMRAIRQIQKSVVSRHVVKVPDNAATAQKRPGHKDMHTESSSAAVSIQLYAVVPLFGYGHAKRRALADMFSPAITDNTVNGTDLPIITDLVSGIAGYVTPRCHKDMIGGSAGVR